MRIGCSGQVSENSGIGIVQKHLYSYLADAGHSLIFSNPRDVGRSVSGRARGLVRGFRAAPGSVDAYLSTVPPLPFGVQAPMLTLVYDLRWLRTRSKAGASYRAWDLRRTVRQSEELVCISNKTRSDLVKFDPRAEKKAFAQWLGPGLATTGSFIESDSGLLMLIGGAAHKRNELSAKAIALSRPNWIRGVVGVGVSEEVRATLTDIYPCEWHSGVSDPQMLALYERAEFFMMLGTNEGFGLPFVEALATGCQVIATDHELAREVVGRAGYLIPEGDAAAVASHLLTKPTVPAADRALHARAFSWKAFGEKCETALMRIASDTGCH